MGIAEWQEGVQCEAVAQRMYEAIWAEIVEGRTGGCADYTSVRQVLQIYQDLGSRGEDAVYRTDFSSPFVEHTYNYYVQEAEELISHQDCSGYVTEAHARISSELNAAAKYVASETMPPLCRACENAFIAEQRMPLQRFFDELLTIEGHRDELKRLFSLLGRVDGTLEDGRRRFQDLVASSGTEAVKAFFSEAVGGGKDRAPGKNHPPPNALQFVETLVGQCTHFWEMATLCFEGDASFLAAAERGFVIFCNSNRSAAELLARSCHEALERGGATGGGTSKDGCDDRGELVMSLVVTILRYILDKDVFQSHYLKLLARRLIDESSTSQQSEETTIQALKTVW